MASINTVTLVGNLGADPEVNYTKDNKSICKLRVATSRYNSDEADWHQVTVFGDQAKNCEKYLHKGAMVGVVGRIQYHEHEGKWYTEIIANTVQFLKTDKDKANESHTSKAPQRKRRD